MEDPISKIRSVRIRELVTAGKLDGDATLPKYPSAQMWKNMSVGDKAEFREIVEGAEKDWGSYEQEMKKHWPPEIKRQIKVTPKEFR